MNKGFTRTLLVLATTVLGLAAAPAQAQKVCTVGTCCQNATQCGKNVSFCCVQSPLPPACVGAITCPRSHEETPADPVLARSTRDDGARTLLGPLSADAQRVSSNDPLDLRRPHTQPN
jgi:hypothetical protein